MHGNVKWDNDRLLDVIKMRINGSTLQEIADKYGCTRENIRQEIGRAKRIMNVKRHYSDVIFPNIREYMSLHDVSKYEISKRTGIYYQGLNKCLKGDRDFSLGNAFKIANLMGMTVDQAFSMDELQEEV